MEITQQQGATSAVFLESNNNTTPSIQTPATNEEARKEGNVRKKNIAHEIEKYRHVH